MKYDLGLELLGYDGYKVNKTEAYILNYIFSNCKIKNVEREHPEMYKIYSFEGIDIGVRFYGKIYKEKYDSPDRMMEIRGLDNNNIKSELSLYTYNNECLKGKMVCKFIVKGEHGCYIITGGSKEDVDFDKNNNGEDKIKLNINYYDKESIEYYKLRSGERVLSNLSDSSFKSYGMLPDSSLSVEYDDCHDVLNLFVNTLGSSNRFFEYIIDLIGMMESSKKAR